MDVNPYQTPAADTTEASGRAFRWFRGSFIAVGVLFTLVFVADLQRRVEFNPFQAFTLIWWLGAIGLVLRRRGGLLLAVTLTLFFWCVQLALMTANLTLCIVHRKPVDAQRPGGHTVCGGPLLATTNPIWRIWCRLDDFSGVGAAFDGDERVRARTHGSIGDAVENREYEACILDGPERSVMNAKCWMLRGNGGNGDIGCGTSIRIC